VVPDIAIIDISMPGLTGLEILAIANSEKLSTRLVFFTSVEDRSLWCHSEGCGARNPGAVVAVSRGRPEVIAAAPSDQTLPREQRKVANTENVLSVLTDRERQIMRLVSEGLSNKGNWAPA
jgi:two-component system nitrate/nitrite response regulator NarL